MAAPFSRPRSIPSHISYGIDDTPPPGRRGRRPRVTRQQMLEAATQEFAAHGYGGSTIASIAARLGVTQPLIHYHFRSKEELWFESVYLLFFSLWNDIELALVEAKNNGSRGSARELLKVVVTALVRKPEVARIVSNEGSDRNSTRMSLLSETYLQPIFKIVGEALDAHGKRASLKKQPPELLLLAFLGATTTVLTLGPVCRELYGLQVDSEESIDKQVALLEALFVG
ncbi:MAG: TetR/AcrR family transcriptional regulator [Proteobacteria bacterium]|nr:TetR/AcrR family transcriptional regulator [Pseudomonadota bacterium]